MSTLSKRSFTLSYSPEEGISSGFITEYIKVTTKRVYPIQDQNLSVRFLFWSVISTEDI